MRNQPDKLYRVNLGSDDWKLIISLIPKIIPVHKYLRREVKQNNTVCLNKEQLQQVTLAIYDLITTHGTSELTGVLYQKLTTILHRSK
jgi:hypothetical protein